MVSVSKKFRILSTRSYFVACVGLSIAVLQRPTIMQRHSNYLKNLNLCIQAGISYLSNMSFILGQNKLKIMKYLLNAFDSELLGLSEIPIHVL